MQTGFDYLRQITDSNTPLEVRTSAVRGFARELQWSPSYDFHQPLGHGSAQDHLVVEHGLEHAAVLTFLRSPTRVSDIAFEDLRQLLTLSYNNLVSWHIILSDNEIRSLNNLSSSYDNLKSSISAEDLYQFSGVKFLSEVSRHKIRYDTEPCDDILLKTISYWKRALKAEYRDRINNAHISALINSLIFVRGYEDHLRKDSQENSALQYLMTNNGTTPTVNFAEFTQGYLNQLNGLSNLESVIDFEKLDVFSDLDRSNATQLVRDFYRPSRAKYPFNFAFMSKHALSRIYERYVTLLEFDEKEGKQISFLPPMPNERSSATTGSVYTPQFVARYFAKFIQDNVTPKEFRQLTIFDPACGSGIFLRTILELQSSPFVPGYSPQGVVDIFQGICGIDRDANACQATRLSLALLHLICTGKLPDNLQIINADAIAMATSQNLPQTTFGAVLANPPFIKLDHLSEEDRSTYKTYLGEHGWGRTDSYLAFVKLSLKSVSESGFACLVLPRTFLVSKNARPFRAEISKSFSVRCIVDMEGNQIFGRVGIYNVLLILQKFDQASASLPPAQVVKARGQIGHALDASLHETQISGPYFSVFTIPQHVFKEDEWRLLNSEESAITEYLSRFPNLSDFMEVRQGLVTGDDQIFIRDIKEVPSEERSAYRKFLPDKKILRFELPTKADRLVFYPFENDRLLTEQEVKKRFPATWKYLLSKKNKLSFRKPVQKEEFPWWRPTRPRTPSNILIPKIVCPHLMISARYAIDRKGEWLVSRSPYLYAKHENEAQNFLRFVSAVLNSSIGNWFIGRFAHKYGNGYNRLEVDLLKRMPIPDPSSIPPAQFNRLMKLVDRAQTRDAGISVEMEIDDIVFEIYEFNDKQKAALLGESA
tara:strand:+ start:852 stop:3488 length:2637 start_codon:yes stop_codon:yes gene_type:complete